MKEDILRKHYEAKFAAPPYDKSVNRKMIFDYVAPAMDEYAQSQSLLFAEFIADNYPEYTRMPSGSWIAYSGHAYTTQELYDLFIKKTQK